MHVTQLLQGVLNSYEICALFEGRDKIICQSLFSWVNDGSHSIHDDLYINHGEQTNEAYLQVFRKIFQKAGQIGHYNMMKGCTSESDEPEELSETSDTEIAPGAIVVADLSRPEIRMESA
jgi:Iap family predicted aminopeptidase